MSEQFTPRISRDGRRWRVEIAREAYLVWWEINGRHYFTVEGEGLHFGGICQPEDVVRERTH